MFDGNRANRCLTPFTLHLIHTITYNTVGTHSSEYHSRQIIFDINTVGVDLYIMVGAVVDCITTFGVVLWQFLLHYILVNDNFLCVPWYLFSLTIRKWLEYIITLWSGGMRS